MRRLVRRENASPGLDLSACVQHAQAEVDVCVAREPHGLDEGSSNESAMVTVCTVVGTVAVGCSRAGSTVVLGSLYFLSLFGPSGAATRLDYLTASPIVRHPGAVSTRADSRVA